MSVDTLLNFNGVNGSQVFTDDGLSPVVWSPSGVTPILSTTKKKFGTSSLRLVSGDNLSSTLTLGTKFTIESWVIFDSYNGATQNIFNFETDDNISNILAVNVTGDILSLWDGSVVKQSSPSYIPPLNVFTHIALTYDAGEVKLYANGSFISSSTVSTDNTSFKNLFIGMTGHSTASMIGYIDDFRVTNNEILYNLISNRPTLELTTTTVQPPALPTNHSSPFDESKNSDTPVGVYIGLSDNHEVAIGVSGSGTAPTPDPTSTNIISGNVKKLGLPFGARVVVVSVGVTPEVVGSGTSDDITGDYSIDVYPYASECLIYVAPDYGSSFVADSFVGAGQVVHPTIPNRYIYVAQNNGTVGSVEPNWSTSGTVTSGGVTFDIVGLHRPLMNGFIKPVVTPI